MGNSDQLSVIIIDDEKKARENLMYILNSYCPIAKVVAEAWDEESISNVLLENKADLIFADIQIHNKTIFDIINYDMIGNSKLIFVSAYEEYEQQGMDFGGSDYLLKPIDPKLMTKAINSLLELKQVS